MRLYAVSRRFLSSIDIRSKLWVLFVSALAAWACTSLNCVFAQEEVWDQPVNLSQSSNDSLYPSVAVDPEGGVHVVWCEAVNASSSNTIYYAGFNGRVWSPAVDIIAVSGGGVANMPRLLSDGMGTLHMVWVGAFGDQILHSTADVHSAGSARGWQTPVAVSDFIEGLRLPDLAMDSAGNLHVIYSAPTGLGAGVYYNSLPYGATEWRGPKSVFALEWLDRAVDQARLAVDEEGGIHVLWTEYNYPEVFPPRGMRYSRSLDGGETWSEPYLIDGVFNNGAIVAPGNGEVHLAWSGTWGNRHEFHMWSADRGATWSRVGQSTPAGGYYGLPSFATDSAGRVHISHVTGLEGTPLVHQVWDGHVWSAPLPLVQAEKGSPSHPSDTQIVVGFGNELHIVVEQMVRKGARTDTLVEQTPSLVEGQAPGKVEGWAYDIYYLYSVTDAPRLETQALAPTIIVPLPTVEPESEVIAEPTQAKPAATTALRPVQGAASPSGGTSSTVVTGVLPSVLLVIGFVIVRLHKKRSE